MRLSQSRQRRSRSAILLFACFSTLQAAAPSIDDSLNFKTPQNPKISPDGRLVAFEITSANWEDNAFDTQIWIGPANGDGPCYPLSQSKKSSRSPEWSPDGKWVAFLSDRDGKNQAYVISILGGEARPISKSETPLSSLHWAPDGRAIAYVAPEPESKHEKDRKDKYGDFEVIHEDYTQNHLWLQPLSGAATEVTPDAPFSVADFDWSPDGKRIAFTAVANATPGASGTAAIYVLDIASKHWGKIGPDRGPDRNPKWSPNGTEIVYQTADGAPNFFYTNDKLAIVPVDGGAPRILAANFDEDKQLVAWTPRGILFEASQKTAASLFTLDPGSAEIQKTGPTEDLFDSSFSVTPDGTQTAFVRSTATTFPEVFVTSLGTARPTKVSALGEQIKNFTFAPREVVRWKSKDGTLIEGILIKPADFDPLKKYPLLVVIHGGPTGTDRAVIRPDRNYPTELFVEKGAVILRPNYRGSAGYGEKMRSLNVRNLGVGDAWDVLSGVDALIAQGFIDPNRLGCMGWSQGGYISAFLTTSTRRFKAISVGAGISDWSTYYVNTDITPFTRQYLEGTPWSDPNIYRKTSPITYVNEASTPTLIQHGELDKRVPIPNGYELRQALEDRGIPVKMVVYKGFGHGIDKPKQQRAVMQHNLDWFSRYLWPEAQSSHPTAQ